MLLLLGYNAKYHIIDVKYAKGKALDERAVRQVEQLLPDRGCPRQVLPALPTIYIDADASTSVASFDFDTSRDKDRQALLRPGPGFPYAVRPGAKTLIIGPGGGLDVARALASGSRGRDGRRNQSDHRRDRDARPFSALQPAACTSAPMCASSSKRAEASYAAARRGTRCSRRPWWTPGLPPPPAPTRCPRTISTPATPSTTTSRHLTGDGVLSFTRWGLDPPRESLRLLSLARVALARLGENEPWRNVIVVREGKLRTPADGARLDTVLISRKPFSADDLARARDAIRRSGFQTIYLPDESIPNPFTELLRTRDIAAFDERYPYNIRPVERRPAVLLLYRAGARHLGLPSATSSAAISRPRSGPISRSTWRCRSCSACWRSA